MASPPTTYDEIPYESHPFAWTHPSHLAAVARVHGLSPPSVFRCRVLELGCASGGNLLPMAATLPEATFVGIDLSRRQIEEGRATVAALGLANVALEHLSILDLPPDRGPFDYILCHGVYSWVPAPVQERILAICARQLAPGGVAAVSYNTYPGWQIRHMVRDILLFHARRFSEPRTQVQQARALLEFLARSAVVPQGSVYGTLLASAVQAFGQRSDSYLLHEYLEEVNEPLYFHQFMERVQAKGLDYLADGKPWSTQPQQFPPEVVQGVQQLTAEPLEQEQYFDFLRNTAFRRSLLVRRGDGPRPSPRADTVPELHVASQAQPLASQPDAASTTVEPFRGVEGRIINVGNPLFKAALHHLRDVFPQTVPFAELRAAVSTCLGKAVETPPLAAGMLEAYLVGLVELHALPSRAVAQPGERPLASALARHQATMGRQVTNLRHEIVELTDVDRHLLRHLDGTHDRNALAERLTEAALRGALTVLQGNVPLRDPALVRQAMHAAAAERLGWLAKCSLLLG